MPKKKTTEPVKKAASPVAGRPNMPGYGIAESADGLLPWKWAADRLEKTQNYFLCTVREDGRPHVMPIWGLWMDDKFFFSTGKNSVKARNLASNPRCVLCADGAEEAVIVEGTVTKLPPKEGLKEFVAAYLKKYKFDPSTMNEPVFVLQPKVTFGQIEKTFPKTATRWTW